MIAIFAVFKILVVLEILPRGRQFNQVFCINTIPSGLAEKKDVLRGEIWVNFLRSIWIRQWTENHQLIDIYQHCTVTAST
jgi:hypothetical protein